MPKYKVGDVAALFPKPSKPKTESGKKIQALFQEFYNKPNNPSKKWKGHEQLESKKPQVDIVNSNENIEESKPKKKAKKRKFQNITDSGIDGNKRAKLENENEQAPFPRQKAKKEKFHESENFHPKKKAKKMQAVTENASPSKKSAVEINSEISKAKGDTQITNKSAPAPFPRSQFKKNKNSETESYLPRKQAKEIREAEMENIFPESGSRKKKAKDPHQEVETASPEKKFKRPKKKFKRAELSSPSVQDQKSKSEKPKVLKEQKSKVVFRMKQQRVIPSCKDIFASTNKEKDAADSAEVHEKKNHRKSAGKDVKKLNKEKVEETDERLSRTLFVGNLSVSTTRKGLEKLFSPFGTLESCRLRGAVPTKATIPKKIADIKRKYHTGLHSRIGYVVFNERKDSIEALSLSGMNIDGHHIVVDRASASGQKKVYDEKRSIFVGNLPFDIEDETLWSTFLQCGDVEAVRVIRDKETGAGKGFGYVLFQKIQAKEKALALTNLEINGRTLRIKSVESGKKNTQNNQQTTWKNAVKRIAFKRKRNKDVNPNSRKTLKKLMKKGKQQHQKKKIANIFRDLSKK